MITDREKAAFEAGIKLGALYHNWVGIPVSKESANSLETAIERSHIQQPFVTDIKVKLDKTLMNPNAFGYSELSGLMYNIKLTTKVNNAVCNVSLSKENGYPMMRIDSIQDSNQD